MAECELNSVLIDLTASALATKLDDLVPKIKKYMPSTPWESTLPSRLPTSRARGSAEFWSNDKVSACLVPRLGLNHFGGILNVPETCFVFA